MIRRHKEERAQPRQDLYNGGRSARGCGGGAGWRGRRRGFALVACGGWPPPPAPKIGSVRGEVRADGRGRARERESERVEYSFGHVADEMVRPETAAVNRSVEEEGD